MTQKILIVIAAAVVAGLGGLLVFGGGSRASAPAGTRGAAGVAVSAGATHVVTLGENGFEPEELAMKRGETVRFVTTNKRFFWPASDIHPTHEIYAAFDPKEPIAPEDSWSFTFGRVGSWNYHDHLAPYFTGVITVAE